MAEATVFKYGLVARGFVPLAEYPSDNDEIHEKSMKILKRLDPSSPHSVVEQSNMVFTAATDPDGMSFVCLCDKSVETKSCGQFLNNLKSVWMQNYGASSSTLTENEKNEEFGPKIKELIDKYNEQSIKESNAQPPIAVDVEDLPEVANPFPMQGIMADAEDPSLPSGFTDERIEESLFLLRLKIWWQRYHLWVIGALLILFVIYLVLSYACGGATLPYCRNSSTNTTSGTQT